MLTSLKTQPVGLSLLVEIVLSPPRSNLFRLVHADATEWHEMPQKLAVPKQFTKAFLIPDGLSRCGNQ